MYPNVFWTSRSAGQDTMYLVHLECIWWSFVWWSGGPSWYTLIHQDTPRYTRIHVFHITPWDTPGYTTIHAKYMYPEHVPGIHQDSSRYIADTLSSIHYDTRIVSPWAWLAADAHGHTKIRQLIRENPKSLTTIFGNLNMLEIELFANDGKDACRTILEIRLTNSRKSRIWDQYLPENVKWQVNNERWISSPKTLNDLWFLNLWNLGTL